MLQQRTTREEFRSEKARAGSIQGRMWVAEMTAAKIAQEMGVSEAVPAASMWYTRHRCKRHMLTQLVRDRAPVGQWHRASYSGG